MSVQGVLIKWETRVILNPIKMCTSFPLLPCFTFKDDVIVTHVFKEIITFLKTPAQL